MDSALVPRKSVTSVLTVLIAQMRPTAQQNVISRKISANGQTLRLETIMTGSVTRVQLLQSSLGPLQITPSTHQQVSNLLYYEQ